MALDANLNRRRFIGTTALTLAATQLEMLRSMKAQTIEKPRAAPPTNASFGPLKQIEAGLLNMGTLKMVQPLVDQ